MVRLDSPRRWGCRGAVLCALAAGCGGQEDDTVATTGGAAPSSGGISATSGGQAGTGSSNATGGTPLGGGGSGTTGGSATGGASTGGSATGGAGTGGSPSGGGGTGGVSTGGVGTGGAGTGGAGTGGLPTGGAGTGGEATGGTVSGGMPTGGAAAGGEASGGAATGGAVTGGAVTGGAGTGGEATGGTGTGGAPDGPQGFVFGEPPAAAGYFRRGINLGNRLEAPNEGEWGGTILASDFPFIAARGFDHVRIPVRFSGHAAGSSPYTLDATFLARVDTVIDQALSADLAVILDMHAYEELALDPNGQRERFVALWTQLAERYRELPETVAFELLNEPYDQLDSAWNSLLAEAVAAVRATNPRRLLVIDAVYWADPSRLDVLTLPDDANLLVAIHLYEPKLFSFQGQSWMGAEFQTTGVVFPGPPATPIVPVQAAQEAAWAADWFEGYNTLPAAQNPSGPATIDAQIALIEAYRTSRGRTVYNGEWGPQDGGDDDSRARLIVTVRERCESAGIGWAIWEDPQNMSLFDSAAGTWNTRLVDALLPR